MTKKKLALLLFVNTVVIVALYFVLVNLGAWFMTPIYIAAATVLGIVFIVLNRGFYAKNAKPEELPNTMTHAEKLAYIQEGKDRLSRTRWMITIIFPLILAIACDLFYLYLFPYVKEMFT